MKKTGLFIAFCTAALLLTSVTGFGQKVTKDYDKTYDFSKDHSYYWIKIDVANPLWQKRIQTEIDEQLAAKGWTKGDGTGDLALSALGTTATKTNLNTFYSGMGGWGWYGGGMATATTTQEQYTTGTLILDMFAASNHQLVWRGVATDTMSDKPEKNEKKVEKAIDKLLEDFPPKPKKD